MSEVVPDPCLPGLAAVIRNAEAVEALESDPQAFLAAHGVPEADRTALLERGVHRLLAYRSLVQNRVRNVVLDFLPRTKRRIGEARLREEVRQFMHARAIDSPYLRDVPREFVNWVAPVWTEDDDVDPWIEDLARWELLDQDLRNDPAEVGEPTDNPIALDRQVRVNGTARLFPCRASVWRIPEAEAEDDPVVEPELGEFMLVVCRNRSHTPAWVVTTPLGAALFGALREGKTLQEAVFAAAEQTGSAVDDTLLAAAVSQIGAMGERDALLGTV